MPLEESLGLIDRRRFILPALPREKFFDALGERRDRFGGQQPKPILCLQRADGFPCFDKSDCRILAMVTRCRWPSTVCSSTNVLLRLPTLIRKPGVRVSLYSTCPLSGALSAR